MTKATRETTKLNFITDQGSTRATVRCACRAERLAIPSAARPGRRRARRGRAGLGRAGADAAAPSGAAGAFARRSSAGSSGPGTTARWARGSGGSQTNAAAETVPGSGPPDGWRRATRTRHPGWPGGAVRRGRRPRCFAATAAQRRTLPGGPGRAVVGSASCHRRRPGQPAADADRPKVNESRAEPDAVGWQRGKRRLSRGTVPLAGRTAVARRRALRAVAGLAVGRPRAGPHRPGRRRISVGWSSSAVRSSSSCREVTTVGEAPAEPSDVSVRLSKPSSYDLTLTRLSPDETPR